MKPLNLCLIQMGIKGLELVKSYPDVLSKEELNKIVFQSIPFGAQDGDFATRTIDNFVICGYIFRIPEIDDKRANIATLTVIYDSMEFQPLFVKNVFSYIVRKLEESNLLSIEIIEDILPKIFDGLAVENFKIKVNPNVTLVYDKNQEEKKSKKSFKKFTKDVW